MLIKFVQNKNKKKKVNVYLNRPHTDMRAWLLNLICIPVHVTLNSTEFRAGISSIFLVLCQLQGLVRNVLKAQMSFLPLQTLWTLIFYVWLRTVKDTDNRKVLWSSLDDVYFFTALRCMYKNVKKLYLQSKLNWLTCLRRIILDAMQTLLKIDLV